MNVTLLGSHPAVDFLNTAFEPDGVPVEAIGSGKAYLDWLAEAGLLDRAVATRLSRQFGAEAMDEAAAEARAFREWVRTWLARWRAAPGGNYRAEVARLNKVLDRATLRRQVVAGREMQAVEAPRIDTPEDLVGLVAVQVAALVTEEEPKLLKSCTGTGCTLWFLDRTKAHGRLFCSAAACGNRAKVAAFRERQRTRG